jgi:hypothetical protein
MFEIINFIRLSEEESAGKLWKLKAVIKVPDQVADQQSRLTDRLPWMAVFLTDRLFSLASS